MNTNPQESIVAARTRAEVETLNMEEKKRSEKMLERMRKRTVIAINISLMIFCIASILLYIAVSSVVFYYIFKALGLELHTGDKVKDVIFGGILSCMLGNAILALLIISIGGLSFMMFMFVHIFIFKIQH